MVRLSLLALTTLMILSQAEASVFSRHWNGGSSVTRMITRSFSSIPDTLKHRGGFRAERPKDYGAYYEFRGLCLPLDDRDGKEKIFPEFANYKNKLAYNPWSEFYDNDYDAVKEQADIPCIDALTQTSDILQIAKYIKDYTNGSFKSFMKNKEKVMNQVIHQHLYALLLEPNALLNLVRPSKTEPASVQKRIDARIERALGNAQRTNENRLLVGLISKAKPDSIDIFFSGFDDTTLEYRHPDTDEFTPVWKEFYAQNKDQVDAATRFARMIYLGKTPLLAYTEEEEFNEALIKVDPAFKQILEVIESNKKR